MVLKGLCCDYSFIIYLPKIDNIGFVKYWYQKLEVSMIT